MHRGYVLVWRKIQDSGLMQMPNTLAVFLHILFSATHKDIKVGTPHGVIELKRGQYISGRKKLAEELEQTEREIRTSLKRLVKLQILTIKTTTRYSIYTIENYSIYQDINANATKGTTNERPTDDQQTTTKQTHNTHKSHKYTPPIPEELLKEWLIHRKKKPVTERVFNDLVKEANKLGWTPIQAVEYACKKSWQGFDASWVKDSPVINETHPALRNWI